MTQRVRRRDRKSTKARKSALHDWMVRKGVEYLGSHMPSKVDAEFAEKIKRMMAYTIESCPGCNGEALLHGSYNQETTHDQEEI